MHRIKVRSYFLLFLTIFLILSGPITSISFFTNNSSALNDATLDIFAENNIMFYDPDEPSDCTEFSTVAPSGNNITWIGDSYSVGARTIIQEKFNGVDFGPSIGDKNSYIQSSKFVSSGNDNNPSGLSILNRIKDSSLRPYLVFALGTNGSWQKSYVDEIVKIADEKSVKVVLVTAKTLNNPTSYDAGNELLRNAANDHSNIAVADWAKNGYNESFFSETDSPPKTHPYANGGYDAWVDVIYKALSSLGPNISEISGSNTGNNLDYEGNQVWSDAELQAIEANRPFYEKSAQEYGMPWQLLAVLHYREWSLLRENPNNGQGPYQFYSSSERNACISLNGASFSPGPLSDSEFQKHTDCAAKRLIDVYGYKPGATDSDLKKMFFRYNGQATLYKEQAVALGFDPNSGEGSPYVMNRADSQRNSKTNPNWKQIICDPDKHLEGGKCVEGARGLEARIGLANQQYGAFVLYSALGGSSLATNCDNTTTLSSGGMTLEEAQQYMENGYKAFAASGSYDWNKNEYKLNKLGPGTRCTGGSFYNCVAFSQYFIATNTTDTAGSLPDGKKVVATLISRGIATDGGHTPKLYAIFSRQSGGGGSGHTGVVLGITDEYIVVGQADCGAGPDGIKAKTIPIDQATSNDYSYAYLTNLNVGN